jgi:hypothetical protein
MSGARRGLRWLVFRSKHFVPIEPMPYSLIISAARAAYNY